MNLLNKYNKNIPKTWNELLKIGKDIRQYEKFNNNLIIYNGLFPGIYFNYICFYNKN